MIEQVIFLAHVMQHTVKFYVSMWHFLHVAFSPHTVKGTHDGPRFTLEKILRRAHRMTYLLQDNNSVKYFQSLD